MMPHKCLHLVCHFNAFKRYAGIDSLCHRPLLRLHFPLCECDPVYRLYTWRHFTITLALAGTRPVCTWCCTCNHGKRKSTSDPTGTNQASARPPPHRLPGGTIKLSAAIRRSYPQRHSVSPLRRRFVPSYPDTTHTRTQSPP